MDLVWWRSAEPCLITVLLLLQIECSSISDYAVKIVKANNMDDGESAAAEMLACVDR